ncbi:Uncharacterised protein [Burkholderia pseudomallei]|nr:Uncharacterised protein [Burkholderia pseudomallei]
MKPTATPPTPSCAKRTTASPVLNAPVSAAATAKRNSTSPAASFRRLSPSSSTISRRGSATRSSTAFAATASGGDTIAPSAKHAAHGSPGATRCTATPTASVVNATAPIASIMMPPTLRLNSSHTEKYAPSINSGGRNTISTRSGSRLTGGSPGRNAMPAPPTSSAAAGGSRSRFASSSSATIARKDSKTSLNAETGDMEAPSTQGLSGRTNVRPARAITA